MVKSEMHSNSDNMFTEIDEWSLENESGLTRKFSFNQKTQKIISNISKLGIPHFFRQSTGRIKKTDCASQKRPVSMYVEDTSPSPSSLDRFMHDSTILMALRDTEAKVLESQKHCSEMELKVKCLEKEVTLLREENRQSLTRERALQSQIQELQIKCQSQDAQFRESSFNMRIKEMELSSDIALLKQRLSTIDTEKQEKKIQKIIECQSKIVEQTLPYTASVENIYDSEDGLFNVNLFDEILKEQSQVLDDGEMYEKLRIQNHDNKSGNFHPFQESDISLSNWV